MMLIMLNDDAYAAASAFADESSEQCGVLLPTTNNKIQKSTGNEFGIDQNYYRVHK